MAPDFDALSAVVCPQSRPLSPQLAQRGFFAFLERYPSPHFISDMRKDACIADAWDVVGRKVAKELFLADTYEISKVSVGLPVGLDSDAISMVRLVLGQGRSR